VDRHLPHYTARNARFFIGIVNAAKMGIFSAGQQPLALLAGFGQDARSGCDDLAVVVSVMGFVVVASGLLAVRGLSFLRRRGSGQRLTGQAGSGGDVSRGREAPGRAAWNGWRRGR
jgi:hypothetical protein